jgi:integrase/recombinase XerD
MTQKKRSISFLSADEIDNITGCIYPKGLRNLRDRALIELLFSTGLRISEALALPESIAEKCNGDTLEVSVCGKGGWQRVVYISPKALKAIKEYIPARVDGSEKLFPMTVRTAQFMVKRRAQAAGVTKRVTPHVFRHSLATDLLSKGVDIRFICDFLGHRSINNTMIYTHCTSEKLKSIHKELYGK